MASFSPHPPPHRSRLEPLEPVLPHLRFVNMAAAEPEDEEVDIEGLSEHDHWSNLKIFTEEEQKTDS